MRYPTARTEPRPPNIAHRRLSVPNRPKVLYTPRAQEVSRMTTDELRSAFLIDDIFSDNSASLTFTDLDRLALAGVRPTAPVTLENDRETGAEFFLQRRELGI